MTNSKRQPYVKGGVTSLRQPYFLGKAVKKAAKAVKKVAKSPIGKAALIGGGLWGLGKMGGIGSSGIGKDWWSKGMGLGKNLLFGKAAPHPSGGTTGGLWNWIKKNPGRAGVLGLGAAGMALPFMAGDEEEEIIDDWSVTPSSIADIRDMARRQDPSLAFLPRPEYVQSGYYLADGGRAGLLNGGEAGQAQAETMLRMEYQKYRNQGGTMSYQQFKMAVLKQAQGQGPMAQGQPQGMNKGGRSGYRLGELVEDQESMFMTPQGDEVVTDQMASYGYDDAMGESWEEYKRLQKKGVIPIDMEFEEFLDLQQGGGFLEGKAPGRAPDRAMAQEGGIMDLGGVEKDYRNDGGFVPLGEEEKADDVPARLSKNEFVFTADAVRAAGGGDIDAGAEVMQNMMENLEAGGEISPESQGAQGMYNNMRQLETRIA